MFTEIISAMNFYTDEVGNPAMPKKFKRKNAGRNGVNDSVRLSPVPAQNTLLAILFFSVVAVAIGYWVLFPPNASNSAKSSAGPEVEIMTTAHNTRNHHGNFGNHPTPAISNQ